MMIAILIAAGLFFLMAGAILVDLGNTTQKPNDSADAPLYRQDLRTVWGPLVAHFGIFLFVLGLIAAALMMEDMDIFVRLFLLILAFVAVLLVLANSITIFG